MAVKKDGKRSTEKVCENGIQEGLESVQSSAKKDNGEEEISEVEAKEFWETFYKALQPCWGS